MILANCNRLQLFVGGKGLVTIYDIAQRVGCAPSLPMSVNTASVTPGARFASEIKGVLFGDLRPVSDGKFPDLRIDTGNDLAAVGGGRRTRLRRRVAINYTKMSSECDKIVVTLGEGTENCNMIIVQVQDAQGNIIDRNRGKSEAGITLEIELTAKQSQRMAENGNMYFRQWSWHSHHRKHLLLFCSRMKYDKFSIIYSLRFMGS